MNPHLSSQQISECLVGMGDASTRRHLIECKACRSEVEAVAWPLDCFRNSVHNWGEYHMNKTFEAELLFPRPGKSFGGHERTAGATSLLIHAGMLALLILLGSVKPVQKLVQNTVALIVPDLRPYLAATKKDRVA